MKKISDSLSLRLPKSLHKKLVAKTLELQKSGCLLNKSDLIRLFIEKGLQETL